MPTPPHIKEGGIFNIRWGKKIMPINKLHEVVLLKNHFINEYKAYYQTAVDSGDDSVENKEELLAIFNQLQHTDILVSDIEFHGADEFSAVFESATFITEPQTYRKADIATTTCDLFNLKSEEAIEEDAIVVPEAGFYRQKVAGGGERPVLVIGSETEVKDLFRDGFKYITDTLDLLEEGGVTRIGFTTHGAASLSGYIDVINLALTLVVPETDLGEIEIVDEEDLMVLPDADLGLLVIPDGRFALPVGDLGEIKD